MGALLLMNFVKLSNEGTRRIRDLMDESSLPNLEFVRKEVAVGFESVRVTLRNNLRLRRVWVDSEADVRLGRIARELNTDQLRIVNYVAEHGAINVSQAQRLLLGKRWQAVRKILMGLVGRDMLHLQPTAKTRRQA